jgi:VIT1/CCC1 family predicted Fe2+/Mn2+ transporter
MSESLDTPPVRRILDPIDRYSEVLFGLYMVLTFTGTMSVATAGDKDVQTMFFAAIGCNTAWGFVDAMMYVLRNMVTRGRRARLVRQVQANPSHQATHRLITEELGPLGAGLDADGIEGLRRWLQAQPAPPRYLKVTRDDLLGALVVFMLVLGSTFPVVLPFLFMSDLRMAMRVSGAIAIAIVFFCGFAWGRYAGAPPWRAGLVMVLIAAVIQAVVILLGG